VLGFRESTAAMQRLGMRAWFEASARALGRPDEFPDGYGAWYLDQMAQEDPILVAKFRTGMIETDVRATIKDIAVPTLWVEGTRTPVLIPAWRALVAANPRIRIVDIKGIGNAIAYRQPDDCIAAVRAFLSERGLWPDRS
jgi:pimeloyl-ACP methyl ester carboxylesterase